MISTKDLSSIPDRNMLYQICKSISVLDAIFAEKWLDRYYLFNCKWADNEEFFEMLNGQGDNLLILFPLNGSVINGMVHEYYPKDKGKLTSELPDIYREFIFGEPVNSIGTTFCIWTDHNSKWTIGEVTDFNDGSSEVLEIFDGSPYTYLNWAKHYFEVEFQNNELALDTISKIYKGDILTKEMVYSLDAKFEHWQQLKEDLAEINYPSDFDQKQ